MKKIFLFIGLILPVLGSAQLDRSVRPQPGNAPNINIKDSEVFTTANGITVILSENHKLPKVSFDIFTGSDPRIEGNKAGLSDMAGELILSGTANRSKDQLDNEKDYIGASLGASSTSISMSCLTKHMDKGLELMSDVLLNANFPQSEFDRIKKQNESGLMAAKSDPSAMARNAEVKVNFPNHPFGGVMTEATLGNITRADVESYYRSTFTPKGSYLVIVGDITKEKATEVVNKYFGSWKGGEAYINAAGDGNFNKGNRVIFVKKPGAVQSVVYISFPMKIRTGDNDQLALTVLNGILGGGGFGTRLMQNLREDKAYTYGCYSSTNITENGSWMSMGGNFRNDVTDSAITQMLYELDRITTSLVEDDELSLTKSSMAGSFARSLERPSTVARFAFNIIKNDLPKDYYQTYLKRLEAITKDDILDMSQKYFTAKNCNIVVVGNEEILEKLKVFDADGKIEILDAFGDPAKEMAKADITADQLIEKYILATTNSKSMKEVAKKMKKIKSYSETTELSMAQVPFPLKSTNVWMAPNKEGSKLEGQGMVFQKSYFDGEKGAMTSMQTGKKEMTAEEIAAKKKASGLIPEMNYKTSGMNYELMGIEEQNGVKMYVLKLNDGETETFEYYSTADFMKMKTYSISENDGETVETVVTYSNYKDVNGIKFAHAKNISMGEVGFTGKVTSIEVNGKVDYESFK
ncbi:MAG: insulinase family protein [Bacteroidetes bacterium]|nr:MAG: insulinase family protein [Bacteroidota bacterium]